MILALEESENVKKHRVACPINFFSMIKSCVAFFLPPNTICIRIGLLFLWLISFNYNIFFRLVISIEFAPFIQLERFLLCWHRTHCKMFYNKFHAVQAWNFPNVSPVLWASSLELTRNWFRSFMWFLHCLKLVALERRKQAKREDKKKNRSMGSTWN